MQCKGISQIATLRCLLYAESGLSGRAEHSYIGKVLIATYFVEFLEEMSELFITETT